MRKWRAMLSFLLTLMMITGMWPTTILAEEYEMTPVIEVIQ